MKAGAELLLELPATALSILAPQEGRIGIGGNDYRRCAEAARVVAQSAAAPGEGKRLFEVAAVGGDHCVLRKL
jgi:hypothetical protein